MVTIAHISDPHVGSPYFVPNLMNRVIVELNELEPDVVVCTGDLTNEGYRQEYKNWAAYRDRIRAPMVTVTGNHDARNVGYLHFEELIGPRHWSTDVRGVRIVGVDSSEPDINDGQIGRERYDWIKQEFGVPAELKIFALHHHLLPVPGTGRERNIVNDAGDALECLQRAGVDLVLAGHKHVPYAWKLEDLFVVNAGTVSSSRLRGNGKPSYNIIEVDGTHVDVWRKYPFHDQERIIQFSTETKTYEKYTARIEREVSSQR